MLYDTQEKNELIIACALRRSIDELFYDVACGITRKRSGYIAAKPPQSIISEIDFCPSILLFGVEFQCLMQNPG